MKPTSIKIKEELYEKQDDYSRIAKGLRHKEVKPLDAKQISALLSKIGVNNTVEKKNLVNSSESANFSPSKHPVPVQKNEQELQIRTQTEGGRRLIEMGIDSKKFCSKDLTDFEFNAISATESCVLIFTIKRPEKTIDHAFDMALELLRENHNDFIKYCSEPHLVAETAENLEYFG